MLRAIISEPRAPSSRYAAHHNLGIRTHPVNHGNVIKRGTDLSLQMTAEATFLSTLAP